MDSKVFARLVLPPPGRPIIRILPRIANVASFICLASRSTYGIRRAARTRVRWDSAASRPAFKLRVSNSDLRSHWFFWFLHCCPPISLRPWPTAELAPCEDLNVRCFDGDPNTVRGPRDKRLRRMNSIEGRTFGLRFDLKNIGGTSWWRLEVNN